ncbi:class I SAM-dependent methyltransferase [Spirosoma sp. BT702]|uniref:Class I SAM-dependent methyltransferase n=1 Tax=Spirosoma profusum TaxID=2771354 RepID=A0A926Y1Q6_9BACT|nr:class I SAM-dependent methyltransferase [Spirosoma profusum]MBD2701988.1 class I SAM-dependent methyltransferase [Spirosoma profusum]
MFDGFDLVAPVYDALATLVFGRRLQRAQVVWLHQIPADASILIVGGGTGWLLQQVLMHCQPRQVLYLETSRQMVNRAVRRIIKSRQIGSVEFRIGDEQTLQSDERYDVVMTPFLLDLFTEETLRSRMIPQLRNVLKPDGQWHVTDFVQPNSRWQKGLLWLMIRFFRLTARIETKQLADWQAIMNESGLAVQQRSRQVDGMATAEIWNLRTRNAFTAGQLID